VSKKHDALFGARLTPENLAALEKISKSSASKPSIAKLVNTAVGLALPALPGLFPTIDSSTLFSPIKFCKDCRFFFHVKSTTRCLKSAHVNPETLQLEHWSCSKERTPGACDCCGLDAKWFEPRE
jgi:hypothetical protein